MLSVHQGRVLTDVSCCGLGIIQKCHVKQKIGTAVASWNTVWVRGEAT